MAKKFFKTDCEKTCKLDLDHNRIRCNALSFDYQGTLDVDERLDSVTGPAVAEALAGALLIVVPEPTCKMVGGMILSNAAFTMWQHWKEERDKQNKACPFDSEGVDYDHHSYDKENDRGHYERLNDSEIR